MCHPEVPAGQPTPEVVRIEVQVPLADGTGMPALLARTADSRGPAVVLIHDIFGRSPFYENLAMRLATAGWVALLPDYFFRQGPLAERSLPLAFARRAHLDECRALDDLVAACEFVKAGERVGSVGFCMGGTLALDLAAVRPDLVTVCYYGYPAGESHASAKAAPRPIDQVDRLQGPILGFWGDQDAGVRMSDVAAFAAAVDRHGVAFEHTIYSGLGHAFMAQSGLNPDHPAYQMACESWTRTLEFFHEHLG
jgi:carboxymethylenebutenolidase